MQLSSSAGACDCMWEAYERTQLWWSCVCSVRKWFPCLRLFIPARFYLRCKSGLRGHIEMDYEQVSSQEHLLYVRSLNLSTSPSSVFTAVYCTQQVDQSWVQLNLHDQTVRTRGPVNYVQPDFVLRVTLNGRMWRLRDQNRINASRS